MKTTQTPADLFAMSCPQFGLPTPQREYKFHPVRRWRIDYYFERDGRKVGLEVEGGVWTGGRHTRAKGFLGDMEKYNAAAVAGIHIIRTTPKNLFKLETFNLINKALTNEGH